MTNRCADCGSSKPSVIVPSSYYCKPCYNERTNPSKPKFDPMEGPFCIDCLHRVFRKDVDRCDWFKDMVGSPLGCLKCRQENGLCGEGAKYYEEKKKEEKLFDPDNYG